MPLDRRHAQAFALLGLVMILWAGNSIVARAVRHDIAPFTLALLRWTGASLVVAPFAIRPLMRDWPAIRKGWKPLLVLGLLGIGAFNALLYSGLQDTTATNALLLLVSAAETARRHHFDFTIETPSAAMSAAIERLGLEAQFSGMMRQ